MNESHLAASRSLGVLALLLPSLGASQPVVPPQPLRDVKVTAVVTRQATSPAQYRFEYTIENPAVNQVPVALVDMDISVETGWRTPAGPALPSSPGFADPERPLVGPPNASYLRREVGADFVPVGLFPPDRWTSDDYPLAKVGRSAAWSLLGTRLVAAWGYPFSAQDSVLMPGEAVGGLVAFSHGLPGIRKMELQPDDTQLRLQGRVPIDEWYPTEDDPPEVVGAKLRLQSSLGILVKTLGPMGLPSPLVPAAFARTIRGWVEESVTLGWLKDPALLSQLRGLLDAVDSALAAGQNATAAERLLALATAARAASPSQATAEVAALVGFNADYLRDQLLIGLPVGWTLTPTALEKALGETASFEVRVSRGPLPVPGFPVIARVVEGPNAPKLFQGRADQDGRYTFEYAGTALGRDGVIVPVIELGESARETPEPASVPEPPVAASAVVDWKGGPDLTLEHLFPPAVEIPSPRPEIVLDEATVNKGSAAAAVSITRYYLSIDRRASSDDAILGERAVPPLGPEETSAGSPSFAVPDIDAGVYWILACADAPSSVPELNETNNCLTLRADVAAVVRQSANAPPVCSAAALTPSALWPPNHKMREVRIEGLTDPDGDPVTVTVTGVTQDEPVNGLGDGDVAPDATLTPLALRAERSGTGNGRVYRVSFTAADGKGGSCTGAVTVCVPHDKGGPCHDDGTSFDSTRP